MMKLYDSMGNAKSLVENSDIECGNNYIKFPNGIAIVWGSCYAAPNVTEGKFTFPFDLFDYKVIATHFWSEIAQGQVTIGHQYKDCCNINIYDLNDDITRGRSAYAIAIGRWK